MGGRSLLFVLLASLSVVTSASATPAVVPGWPVPSPGGSVHLTSDGHGVVVIADRVELTTKAPTRWRTTAIRFSLDGVPRWNTTTVWRCDACLGVPQPIRLQTSGSYGPLGPHGLNTFTQTGVAGAGCPGVTINAALCVDTGPKFSLRLRTIGPKATTKWTFSRGPDAASAFFPPSIAGDGDIVAVSLRSAPADPERDQRSLVGVRVADGQVAWRHDRPGMGEIAALAGLPGGGVLATGIVSRSAAPLTPEIFALDHSGNERWSLALANQVSDVPDSFADPAHGQILLPTRPLLLQRRPEVVAVDLASGAVRWSHIANSLLSVGPTGNVYINEAGGVIALSSTGDELWRYPTAGGPPSAARELPDGRVAINQAPGVLDGELQTSPLTLLVNPAITAPAVEAPDISLSRTRFSSGCVTGNCDAARSVGTIARIALPARANLSIRLRGANGKPVAIGGRRPLLVTASAGVNYIRILGGNTVPPGNYRLTFHLRGAGVTLLRSFPIATLRDVVS